MCAQIARVVAVVDAIARDGDAVTVPQHRFTTSGGEMAYLDEGDGPAVVLLHGFPSSSFLWREFIPLLAGRFRVIAPDLLGAGDSAQPEDAALHIRAQAAYVRELLAHLGVERFAVVGHGVGGGVAQLLALDGAGVDAMVLLDSVAFDRWPSEARAGGTGTRRRCRWPADARAGGGGDPHGVRPGSAAP